MDKSRDCVLFATADWHTPYWTNKQHTAVALAKNGFRVLYIESIGLRAPTFNTKDIKRMLRRLINGFRKPKEVAPNIWVLAPLVFPFKHHTKIVRFFNQMILFYRIKFFLKQKKINNPLIWTYHPFVLQIIKKIFYSKIVYHCVDDLAAVPGVHASAFLKEEEMLLQKADVVFTTSMQLYERVIKKNKKSYFFPNVVDFKHFNQARHQGKLPAELMNTASPRIIYMGMLSDYKVDFALLFAMAHEKKDWQWFFIGDEREGQKSENIQTLKKLKNVHFLGYQPYAVLPNYLRGMDVAIFPTLINKYTKSMFPMKYFEYLAAGLPIVSTPLLFTKTFNEGLLIANNKEEFINAIAKQLHRGHFTVEESKMLVGDHTWDKRLKKMLALIN